MASSAGGSARSHAVRCKRRKMEEGGRRNAELKVSGDQTRPVCANVDKTPQQSTITTRHSSSSSSTHSLSNTCAGPPKRDDAAIPDAACANTSTSLPGPCISSCMRLRVVLPHCPMNCSRVASVEQLDGPAAAPPDASKAAKVPVCVSSGGRTELRANTVQGKQREGGGGGGGGGERRRDEERRY